MQDFGPDFKDIFLCSLAKYTLNWVQSQGELLMNTVKAKPQKVAATVRWLLYYHMW